MLSEHLRVYRTLAQFNMVPTQRYPDGRSASEIGGELPCGVVSDLKECGAEVLRYARRGVVSTVVIF